MEKNKQEKPIKKLGGCTGKGFMPGVSGNPGGRTKSKELDAILKDCLNANEIKATIITRKGNKSKQRTISIKTKKTMLHALVVILIEKGLSGDTKAIQEIFDRYVGKPPMGVNVKDDNKGELIEAIERLVDLSPDK